MVDSISIITVCFNGANTLEQTIRSVVNQTYSNIEYIIIDGKSTDGTVDIIKKYQDKIAYWVSEPDSGIYDAMNKGIEKATGDYIYFIGSDDSLLDKNIIAVVANYLKEDSNIDVLSGGVWVIDKTYNLKRFYDVKFTIGDINCGYRVPHQGCFVRTKVIKQFYFDTNFKIVADYDLFLKLWISKKFVFKYVNDAIANYASTGISSCRVIEKVSEDVIVMKKHGFSSELIEQYRGSQLKSNFNICLVSKSIIKKFFKIIGIFGWVQKQRGWYATEKIGF